MGKFKFKADKDGGFVLPPEGTFDLQIVEAKPDTSNNGDPQIVVKVEIADGPHEGMAFRQFYTANEERGWALLAMLKATGIDYEMAEGDEGEPSEFEFDPDDLIHAYFRATIVLNRNEEKKKTYINLREEQASTLSDAGEEDEEEDAPADEPPPAEEEKVDEPPAAAAKSSGRRRARPRA